jgi:hypothetical protein
MAAAAQEQLAGERRGPGMGAIIAVAEANAATAVAAGRSGSLVLYQRHGC